MGGHQVPGLHVLRGQPLLQLPASNHVPGLHVSRWQSGSGGSEGGVRLAVAILRHPGAPGARRGLLGGALLHTPGRGEAYPH